MPFAPSSSDLVYKKAKKRVHFLQIKSTTHSPDIAGLDVLVLL
jgi:hypothetical protein